MGHKGTMQPVIFVCSQTGRDVQGLLDESLIGLGTVSVPIECPLCKRPHLVHPADLNLPNDNGPKHD